MPVTNRPVVRVDPKVWDVPIPSNGWPVTVRVKRLNFQDYQVQGAVTTANVDISPFPAGLEILGAFFYVSQNFTGGAIATATLSAGTTGTPTAYIAATTVFAVAPRQVVGVALPPGTFLTPLAAPAAAIVRAQLVVTGANVSALLTGKADLYMRLSSSDLRTA